MKTAFVLVFAAALVLPGCASKNPSSANQRGWITTLPAIANDKGFQQEKYSPPTVQQAANPMDQSGRGDPQSSGTGAVEQGGNAPGRGDPTGTAAPGGAVTSPTPTGPGRGDNR
jgi:hypothetical protein